MRGVSELIKAHEAFLEKGRSDEGFLAYHLLQIGFLQHERLVHLIVMLFVIFCSLAFLVLFLFLVLVGFWFMSWASVLCEGHQCHVNGIIICHAHGIITMSRASLVCPGHH